MGIEKDLRKCDSLCGTWILLGNGEKWCIPAMPLAKTGRQKFLNKIEALVNIQVEMETVENQLQVISKYMDAAIDLVLTALQINYPKITLEKIDELNLVTMQHVGAILEIVKGDKEIGAVIGVSSCDGGEARSRATT